MSFNRFFAIALALNWFSLCVLANAEAQIPARWIWGSAAAQQKAAAGRCDFRRSFELGKVSQAVLRISCDDQYVLRLNGRMVGLGSNWKQLDAYDIAPLLKAGTNELVIRCRNENSAAGLLLRIDAKLENGKPWELVSDAQWESRLQQAGTWDPTIVSRTPWKPAHELATYGPEGAPWGTLDASGDVRTVRFSKRTADDAFQLVDGDRVLFLGNTFIERSQLYGHLEAALTTAFPSQNVLFRNLGWSGDTVFGHARARFGTVEQGFQHLETHVFGDEPTVVFVNYGTNESFKGKEGLAEFTQGLVELIDVVSATGAYVVLVTPVPHENLGPPLPDAAQHNPMLRLYRDAIVAVAKQQGCGVVDLFNRLPEVKRANKIASITENGMHLGELGYWCAGQALLAELGLPTEPMEVEIDTKNRLTRATGAVVDEVKYANDRVVFGVQPEHLHVGTAENDASAGKAMNLKLAGLSVGRYSLVADGHKVATATAAEWAAGVALNVGDQSQRLLEQIGKKNELYFHRWRPQNETYLFLFRKHEQGNNAVEIPQFDPLIEAAEGTIATLRNPRRMSLELVRESNE